jgi:L-glutamine-phosphate cytidylyltransferase
MRGIVIGAGRGQRLMPTTADAPKCFTEIGGQRILDVILSALRGGGVLPITFIGGYLMDVVRAGYPELDFVENPRWAETNVLGSLMCAEPRMRDGFVSSYADIVYPAEAVARVVAHPAAIAIVVDTAWRPRYQPRTQHPPSDGEKVLVGEGRVARIHRDIDPDAAHGEFIGVAKFSPEGAASLCHAWHHWRERGAGGPFRGAPSIERGHMILLLQQMIEDGVEIAHVDIAGGYHEIDTQQDYELARAAHERGERWG